MLFTRSNKEVVVNDTKECQELKLISDENGEEILNEIIDNFITDKSMLINSIERKLETKDVLKKEIENYLNKKQYKFNEEIYKSFKIRIWGYGELQPLIDLDNITDIKIIKDTVRTKIFGVRKTSKIKFKSKKAAAEYINRIAVKNGITLSEIKAQQLVTDAESSDKYILRIDMTSAFLNSDNCPYMHIRLIPKEKLLLQDLKQRGMFNDVIQKHLVGAMRNGLSLIVCGRNGCGKTFLMNALLEEIPHNESGLAVQESGELFCNTHPDLKFYETKELVGESKVEYSLQELIKNALVSDFDRIMAGEIKDAEAFDIANVSYTGSISMLSVHAISSSAAPSKLVHYMKYSDKSRDMTEGNLLETLVGFDEIIFIDDFTIKEITQIAGFDRKKEELVLNPIFKYEISSGIGKYETLNDDCTKVKDKIAYSEFKRKKLNKVVN